MKTLFCCFYVLKKNLSHYNRQQAWFRLYFWLCSYVFCCSLIESFTTFLTSSVGIPLQSTLLQVSIMHKCENLYYTLFSVPWNSLLFLLFTIYYWFISSCATGSHDIHIDVRGESMLAKLLRKTIGAFNTSANIDLQTSNWRRWFSSSVHFIFFTLLCNYAVSFM